MALIAVEYFYGGDWWGRAHRAGCADTKREANRNHAETIIPIQVSSLRELIEEMASDFIFDNEQQPWTDYLDEVSVAPCLHLPKEA